MGKASYGFKEGSDPVYVRARAFCGSQYELIYAGNDWLAADDGFYLYKGIVEGGKTTTELTITVKGEEKKNSFDVTVIYESIPVQYDEDGNTLNPVVKTESGERANPAVDWNKKLDVIESNPAGEITDSPDTNPDGASGSGGTQDQTPGSGESQDQASGSGGTQDQTPDSGQNPAGTGQESGVGQDAEPNGGEG